MTAPNTAAAGAEAPAAAPAVRIDRQSIEELQETLGMNEGDTPDGGDADAPVDVELEEVEEVAEDGEDADGVEGDDQGEPASAEEADGDAGADPDPAPAPAARPSAAKFTVRNHEGRQVTLPKGTTIEFEQDGKVVRKPVDSIVRMAMGMKGLQAVYNQRDDLRAELTELHDVRLPRIKEFIQQQLEEKRAWFEDETGEAFEKAREEYKEANTPAARLAARERADREREERETAARTETKAVEWFNAELVPRLMRAYTPFAEHITQDELAGRVLKMTAPYKGPDGRIRPRYFEQVLELIEKELPPWLEHRALERQDDTPVAPRRTAAAAPAKGPAAPTRRDRVQSQIEKSRSARQLRPPSAGTSGGSKTSRPGANAQPAVRNAKEANSRIIDDLFK